MSGECRHLGCRISPGYDEARLRHRCMDARPDRVRGVQHRLDVRLIVQRAGEAQCRHIGFRSDAVEQRDVHAVRHDMHRVASADPAQPSCIRLADAYGRGVAAHGAAGVARRDGDLAQRAIALAKVAVGHEAAPELQRIAVDHVDHRARQVGAVEPERLGSGPDQGAIGAMVAHRTVHGGAERGLVEAPRVGDAMGGQRQRNMVDDSGGDRVGWRRDQADRPGLCEVIQQARDAEGVAVERWPGWQRADREEVRQVRQCKWEAAVVPVRLLMISTLLLHQSIRRGEVSAAILAN